MLWVDGDNQSSIDGFPISRCGAGGIDELGRLRKAPGWRWLSSRADRRRTANLASRKAGSLSKLQKRIYDALVTAEEASKGQAYFEAGFKLGESPASWVQPDLSFVRGQRIEDTEDSGYLLGAPELAIEVVSPSESASDLNRKVDLMLQTGSLAVWVVYPGQRKVHVHLPGATTLRLGVSDTLSLPELLPGWELPVANLLQD